MAKKKLSKKEQIICCVDDEIYLLIKRIEFKYNLSWGKAKKVVNEAIRGMYGIKPE